jgi:hypothetical protein
MFLLQFKKWINSAIINAGITILFWDGFMPDLTVGLDIEMLNSNAKIKN